jgi:hypothetical protein
MKGGMIPEVVINKLWQVYGVQKREISRTQRRGAIIILGMLATANPEIVVGEIETIFPVNPSQQEILITQGLDPESFYVHAIYEFTTVDRRPVSQSKLYSAWSTVVG